MSKVLTYRFYGILCAILVVLPAARTELTAQFPIARHYDNLDFSLSSETLAGLDATPDGGYIMCGSSGVAGGLIEPIIVKTDAGGQLQWQRWLEGLPNPVSARLLDIVSADEGSLLLNPYGGPDVSYVAVGYRTDLDEYFLVGLDAWGTPIFLHNSDDLNYPACASFSLNKVRRGVLTPGYPADEWAAVGSYYRPNQFPQGDYRITRLVSAAAGPSFVEYDNLDRNDFGNSLTVTNGNVYICGDTYPVAQPMWNDGYVICAPPDASPPFWANRYYWEYPIYFLDIIPSHDSQGIVDGLLICGYTTPLDGPADVAVVKLDLGGTELWTTFIDEGANEYGRSIRQYANGDILVTGMRLDGSRYEGYVVQIDAAGSVSTWRVADPAPVQDYTSFFDLELTEPDGCTIVGSTADFSADYYDGYFSRAWLADETCYFTAGNPTVTPFSLIRRALVPEVTVSPALAPLMAEAPPLNLSLTKDCDDSCPAEVQNGQNSFQWSYGSKVDFGLEGLQDPAEDFALVGYTYSDNLRQNDIFLVKTDSDGDSETPGSYRRRIYIDDPNKDWWEYGHSIDLSVELEGHPEVPTSVNDGYVIAGTVEDVTPPYDVHDRDAYYVKVDLNGDVLWSRRLGKPQGVFGNHDEARSVRRIVKRNWRGDDYNDGYVIAGWVNGSDKGYNYDALVMRTDNDGLVPGGSTWSRAYHTPFSGGFPHPRTFRELAYHAEPIDTDGDEELDDGIIVGGIFEYHKSGQLSVGHPDLVYPPNKISVGHEYETCTFPLVFRLDMNGDIEWAKVYGSWFNLKLNGEQQGYHVEPTDDDGDGVADDGFIVVGAIYRVEDLTYRSWDALAMKIDRDGELQWHRAIRFGTGDDEYKDWARGVVQTSDGGFVITGATEYRYESAPDDYREQAFLLKLDCDGELMWCTEMPTDLSSSSNVGLENGDLGSYVQETQDGGLMMLGGSCTFNASVSGFRGDGDLWLVKTRCDGQTCLARDLAVTMTEVDFRSEDKELEATDYETPVAVNSTSATLPCDTEFRNCQYQACFSAAPSASIATGDDRDSEGDRRRDPLENVPPTRRVIREGAPFVAFPTDVTGIKRASGEGLSVSAYPNPAPAGCELRLQIELSSAAALEFVLYDALGKTILQQRLQTRAGYNAIPLQLPKLTAGAYHFALMRDGVTLGAQPLLVLR